MKKSYHGGGVPILPPNKNIKKISSKQLAEFMHDTYEDMAIENNWNTQENCKVEFNKLPKENKKTMIEVAKRIIKLFN